MVYPKLKEPTLQWGRDREVGIAAPVCRKPSGQACFNGAVDATREVAADRGRDLWSRWPFP